jgi:hypothetical protein
MRVFRGHKQCLEMAIQGDAVASGPATAWRLSLYDRNRAREMLTVARAEEIAAATVEVPCRECAGAGVIRRGLDVDCPSCHGSRVEFVEVAE